MTYFDELRDASLGGVPFEAFSLSDGGGRRGTVNEYPNSEEATFNDRGKKTKPFKLRISIFGEDVLQQHQSLKKVLDKKGQQLLIHPTDGEMQVTCTDWQRDVRSSTGERINYNAEFFRVPGVTTGVKVLQKPETLAATKKASLLDKVRSVFTAGYNTIGEAQFVVDSAINDFTSMTNTISQFLAAPVGVISSFTNALETIITTPETLINETQQLIATAIRAASIDAFGSSTQNGTGLRSRTTASGNAFTNARDLQTFATGWQDLPTDTNTQITARNNSRAIEIAVRASAAEVEVDLHLGQEGATLYQSQEEANQATRSVLSHLTEIKSESADLATETTELMVATATAANALYGLLAQVREITVQNDTDTIVLSYELYDELEREEEIRINNELTDTFVPRGTTLRVLEK